MEINVRNNIAKTIFKYDTKKEYLIMFPTINWTENCLTPFVEVVILMFNPNVPYYSCELTLSFCYHLSNSDFQESFTTLYF